MLWGNSFSYRVFIRILRKFICSATLGITAFLVMRSGGIDFSVDSLAALTGMIVAASSSLPIGVVFAIFISLLIGFINGIISIKTSIKPYIVTFAMMFLIRAIAFRIPKRDILIKVNSEYLHIQILLLIFIFGVTFFLLSRNYGIIEKKNQNSSLVKNSNISILYYLLSALSAGIIGIFLTFYQGVAFPQSNTYFEVDAIMVAVLGGVFLGYAAINLISVIIAALINTMLYFFFIQSAFHTRLLVNITILLLCFIPIILRDKRFNKWIVLVITFLFLLVPVILHKDDILFLLGEVLFY